MWSKSGVGRGELQQLARVCEYVWDEGECRWGLTFLVSVNTMVRVFSPLPYAEMTSLSSALRSDQWHAMA